MEPTRATLGCAVVLMLVAVGACALVHKTIQSDDGDVIDCVDVYQQPALKGSSPGDREIQAMPKRSMQAMAAAAGISSASSSAKLQTWRKRGSCPAGTVPIRRASARAKPEVAQRARPFQHTSSNDGSSFNFPIAMDIPTGTVEVAATYGTNGPYLGARADVPYWRIDVHPDEFSMNYILIGNTLDTNYVPMPGAKPPAELTNQIAVGVVAWPSQFGDSLLRLFVYYTENSPFALEAAFSDSDSQEPGGENWWVSVMGEVIGYYPETTFNTRFSEAVYVEMGGRVLNTRPGGNHTRTPMGSGVPACAGSGFAAAIKEYFGIASDGTLFDDQAERTFITTPSCYGAYPLGFGKTRPGYDVVFGGPGGIYCDQTA
ncbi:hypothetical protein U9M48_029859 [Paspalum notatum var. saurae]|uniref:Neprosin PEP catalytic domain-containing protein n=1 Tax=Paspalum notatum var. saurae TaxID=547442 RepID=A0AAQ3U3T9_PASNO